MDNGCLKVTKMADYIVILYKVFKILIANL